MKKLKICVYAISKNEEKFVKRWMNSIKDADEIFVLDTGSTDNTVNLLKEMGAKVKTKIIKPWRFDTARNESLKLIPEDYDVCVCLDIDEIIDNLEENEIDLQNEKINLESNRSVKSDIHRCTTLKELFSKDCWSLLRASFLKSLFQLT